MPTKIPQPEPGELLFSVEELEKLSSNVPNESSMVVEGLFFGICRQTAKVAEWRSRGIWCGTPLGYRDQFPHKFEHHVWNENANVEEVLPWSDDEVEGLFRRLIRAGFLKPVGNDTYQLNRNCVRVGKGRD